MRIVQITTDNREPHRRYSDQEPDFGMAPDALFQGLASIQGIEVHVISCVRQPVNSPAKIYGSIHYHSIVVPKSGWISTFYQGCIRATRKLVREIKPDIVHGQGTERECSMCAVYSGFPNVLTIHGNMAELNRLGKTFQRNPGYGRLVSMLETHALRRAAGVFCNSAYTEALVAPRARFTWQVPNPIRKDFLSPPFESPTAPPVPLILNIGQVTPRKRQLELLRALRVVHEKNLKFKIIFAGNLGDDEYGTAFKAELTRANTAGYADHIGFLDEKALISKMDQSRGLIHFPSEEAFGLVVAEGMARGLKFFGARLGGIVEIARDVQGAELFDSIEELIPRFMHWLGDGAKRTPEAAGDISNRYSPEVIASRHVEIYRSVLGETPGHPAPAFSLR